MGRRKLVCGWGINDASYQVIVKEFVDGKKTEVWRCPYYIKWCDMLHRCLNPRMKNINPTYEQCTVCDEWKYLSNFIEWVDSQPNKDWQKSSPDKDILFRDNKHYSPDTVVFIPHSLNTFIISCGKARGGYMLGVSYAPSVNAKNPFRASCRNPFTKKNVHIGYFSTEIEAHLAWQAKKHEYACVLADMQEDERVASRLREMYALDKDWTKA